LYRAPGLELFRHVMFNRPVPNLREIGLMSPRVLGRYEQVGLWACGPVGQWASGPVGLMRHLDGVAADQLTPQQLLVDMEQEPHW
jgi:hypothetical protein